MYKAFISSYNLFSFLRYLHCCPDIFGCTGKRLDKKAKVSLKIYDVTNWNKSMYKLPDISKHEGNQTIKYRQLIEYDVKNIFLQKSCRKWSRRTSFGTLLFFKKALFEVKATG